jgi:pyridinium-3,5-biscarboxylic acid mononucleotide sulfurtransferase
VKATSATRLEPATPRPPASLVALRRSLQRLGRVVVAFSGGADSALVARVAHDTLGRGAVLCATALSPSLAADEEQYCRSLAEEWGLRWTGVPTREMQDPAYVANGADRCARCKTALMAALGPLAAAEGATVVLGVNVSDLGDHRPGQAAAAAGGAVFPLVEAGFTKADIRTWSRRLGLRTWDKPAAACLASRLPYGTPVTLGRLSAVDSAESALKALGFSQLRVRHHGDAARLEVEATALAEVLERRAEVVAAVRAAGFTFVALDLEGFRSGSLNRVLGQEMPVRVDERLAVNRAEYGAEYAESEAERGVDADGG